MRLGEKPSVSINGYILLKLVAFFMLYLCYIDESGTSSIPGNTSHYVLCGVSIPVKYWKTYTQKINKIKKKYRLENTEIHTGWILRKYTEQAQIPNFDTFSDQDRRNLFNRLKFANLSKIKKNKNYRAYKNAKKEYKKIDPYIHLTFQERIDFLNEIGDLIDTSRYIRIFAECIDKNFCTTLPHVPKIEEQAIEQVVSRFENYMKIISKANKGEEMYGILVHDNNQSVEKKHTALIQKFHKLGTVWTNIDHVVETPFFVDSQLNTMVQIADFCALALRRFFENGETDFFNKIKSRFDRKNSKIVGVRHYSPNYCTCEVCSFSTSKT